MILQLDSVCNKIVGLLTFGVETPIHVGAGGVEVRRSFLKVEDRLVIPSSTWKGAFRSMSERIAKNMKFNGVSSLSVKFYRETTRGISYSPANYKDAEFVNLRNELISVHKGLKPEALGISRGDVDIAIRELGFSEEVEKLNGYDETTWNWFTEALLAVNCPIGRLYGNNYVAAKVRFVDTVIKGRTSERAGIGINRRALKVEEEFLYFMEALSESDVKLMFIACNLKPGEGDSKLFASTLQYVREMGMSIGGSKSRGLGHLTIKGAKIFIIDLTTGSLDDKMLRIVNPFKHVPPTDLEGLIKWLRGWN
ncbi:MAG: RAMP superfamily CRISPR-associated protein [Candidatus Bathyarchaeia archaeon]